MNSDYESFRQRMGALGGALFLFGLALVFWLDILIPGLLAVILVAVTPPILADKGWRYGLWILAQMILWLGGVPLLLMQDWLWPWVLALAGGSALLVALAPPDELEARHLEELKHRTKRKRKHGAPRAIPLPDADDDADDLGRLEIDIARSPVFDDHDDDDDAYADGAIGDGSLPDPHEHHRLRRARSDE